MDEKPVLHSLRRHQPRIFLSLTSYTNYKLWSVLSFISISATFLLFFGLKNKTRSLQQATARVHPYPGPDPCRGRYIYIQNPPSRFSQDLLRHCETTHTIWIDRNVCAYLDNLGIGPRLRDDDGKGALSGDGSWYLTNVYALSVLFHSRMLNYKCLTNDSSLASAVYIPYYAGLDASRHLWTENLTLRDESAEDFARWVGQTAEWKRMWGRDHFIVSGRTAWDFRRGDEATAWGTRLRLLPQSHNMSMLAVESSLCSNDLAIPYPTWFHPFNDTQILQWQRRIRTRTRRYLFSFAGAPRAKSLHTLRGKIIEECRGSNGLCKLLGCGFGVSGSPMECDKPVRVMTVFQDSIFCLQPIGDSYTRKSFFDSIVAGCIPVLFHPATAYAQYHWFLPEDHTKYSVYIPVEREVDWTPGVVINTLLKIPKSRVEAMREEVIRLVPRVIYAHPTSRLSSYEDAFDVAVNGMLERIAKVRRRIEEGEDPSVSFAVTDGLKFAFSTYHPGT